VEGTTEEMSFEAFPANFAFFGRNFCTQMFWNLRTLPLCVYFYFYIIFHP